VGPAWSFADDPRIPALRREFPEAVVVRARVQGSFGAENAPQDDSAFLAQTEQQVPPLRRRWRSGFGRDDRVFSGGYLGD